jgi:hypothetical protein
MDFMIAVMASGMVSTVILLVALVFFGQSYMRIKDNVSTATRRSLAFLAAAAVMIVLLGATSSTIPELAVVWMSLFATLIVNSEVQILAEDENTHFIGAVTTLIPTLLVVVYTFVMPGLGELLVNAIVIGMFGLAILLGLRLVSLSPSPFSFSLITLSFTMALAWFVSAGGILAASPEYFMLLNLPIIIASAVLAAMSRPWRFIVILALGFFAFTTSSSLAIASLLSRDYQILVYVLVAAFGGLAALYPLDYFLEQASLTRARTPTYIATTQVGISLLVITHSNAWAIAWNRAIERGVTIAHNIWDVNFLFLDWVIGVLAVSSLLLAAISSSASERVLSVSLDSIFFIGSAFFFLGHPLVRLGKYELDTLYLPLAVLILIAATAFFRVALRIRRAGSASAAARFMLFIFASLGAGLAAMFSDQMWLVWPPLVVIIMVVVGFMMLASSPAGLRRLKRRRRPNILSVQEVEV